MLESLILHDPTAAHVFHTVCEWLALSGGFLLYRRIKQQRGEAVGQVGSLWVIVGCLFGAAIGNKLVSLLHYPEVWTWLWHGQVKQFMWAAVSGQSVVGGLLGGWLGVEVGKKIAGIRSRTGDDFVVPILVGLMIGRTGCFVAGLHDGTYGVHTDVPWAVDFGDGLRHPTQLYEWLMAALALVSYRYWRTWLAHEQGLAFRALMVGYLLWRLLIDGLKPLPEGSWLLSGIQWVCVVGLVVIVGTYRPLRFPAKIDE